jgi:hypothetical protein
LRFEKSALPWKTTPLPPLYRSSQLWRKVRVRPAQAARRWTGYSSQKCSVATSVSNSMLRSASCQVAASTPLSAFQLVSIVLELSKLELRLKWGLAAPCCGTFCYYDQTARAQPVSKAIRVDLQHCASCIPVTHQEFFALSNSADC